MIVYRRDEDGGDDISAGSRARGSGITTPLASPMQISQKEYPINKATFDQTGFFASGGR
jgi:hypothetical protein